MICESIHSSLENVALINYTDNDNDGNNVYVINNNHDYENMF